MHVHDGAVDGRFAELMVTLAESLGVRLTEARIRLYAHLLGDVTIDDLRVAFGRAARERTSGFFPTVGELRSFLGPTVDDGALIAWTALGRAAAEAGAYATIEFEDALAASALVDVFGSWAAFCATEDGPALALKRQEFLAAYRQARRVGLVGPRELPGLGEPMDQAAHTWQARVRVTGDVVITRAFYQLTEGNHVAPALSEVAGRPDPEAGEAIAQDDRESRQGARSRAGRRS